MFKVFPFRWSIVLFAGMLLPGQTPDACSSCRISVDEAAIGTRFVHTDSASGNQFQVSLRARVKLDKAERFTLHHFVQTGDYFSGGWNRTGWGLGGHASPDILWKAAYLAFRPVSYVEYQGGMIGMSNGRSSDVLAYAGPGGLTGHRLILRAPRKGLFFDELSGTAGTLRIDIDPSVIERASGFRHVNYQQLQWQKSVRALGFSASYAHELGFKTWREALAVQIAKEGLRRFRVEAYERTGRGSGGRGALAAADFAAGSKMEWTMGFLSVDRLHPNLNHDSFWRGRRIFGLASYRLASGVTMFAGANQVMGGRRANPDTRHFVWGGISYDVVSLWDKGLRFF